MATNKAPMLPVGNSVLGVPAGAPGAMDKGPIPQVPPTPLPPFVSESVLGVPNTPGGSSSS